MSSVCIMTQEEINQLHLRIDKLQATAEKMTEYWNAWQGLEDLKNSVQGAVFREVARDINVDQAIDKLKDDMEKAMWAIKELARCVRGLSKHIAKNHPESYPGGWSDVDIGEYSDSEEEIMKRIVPKRRPNLTDDEPVSPWDSSDLVWMEEEEEEEEPLPAKEEI